MKAAVVYYSETGNTEKVAKRITDTLRREGVEAELLSVEMSDERSYEENVEEAKREKKVKIEPVKTDLSDFDLLFIGSPVWCGKPATPINTYMEKCEGLNNLKIICFITHGGGGPGKTFEIIETDLVPKGGKIVDTLSIASDGVDDNVEEEKIESVMSRWIT